MVSLLFPHISFLLFIDSFNMLFYFLFFLESWVSCNLINLCIFLLHAQLCCLVLLLCTGRMLLIIRIHTIPCRDHSYCFSYSIWNDSYYLKVDPCGWLTSSSYFIFLFLFFLTLTIVFLFQWLISSSSCVSFSLGLVSIYNQIIFKFKS
jgi:hypothetical protein